MTDYAELVKRWRMEADAMHVAPSGDCLHGTFHARDWADKPHRVLFAAIGIIREAADAFEAQAARIAELEQWNQQMVEKAAGGGTLDGYRALGQRVAKAETRAEAAEAEAAKLRADVDEWRNVYRQADEHRDRLLDDLAAAITERDNARVIAKAALDTLTETGKRLTEAEAAAGTLRAELDEWSRVVLRVVEANPGFDWRDYDDGIDADQAAQFLIDDLAEAWRSSEEAAALRADLNEAADMIRKPRPKEGDWLDRRRLFLAKSRTHTASATPCTCTRKPPGSFAE
jgi:hypothetical protein